MELFKTQIGNKISKGQWYYLSILWFTIKNHTKVYTKRAMAKKSPPVSKFNDIGVTLVKTWHFLRNVFWGFFFLCATNDLYLLFYRYLENKKVRLFLFIIKRDSTAGKVYLFTPLILSAGYSVYTTPYPCITNMCRCV